MRNKFLCLVILLTWMLGALATAQVRLTTASGKGADGGVSNDSNAGPAWIGGITGNSQIRRYDTVRAKGQVLRFDVAGLYGAGLSGATLSIVATATSNRARTMNVYGLADGADDLWNEATLSYNTAPGVLPAALGYITLDTSKWSLLGTIPFAAGPATNTASIEALADMISKDTNGLITLFLYTATSDSSQGWYCNLKEAGVATAPAINFPNARFATNPQPANGDIVLPSVSQLCWTNPEPNGVGGVFTHDIYFSAKEPNTAAANYGMTLVQAGYSGTCINMPGAPLAAGMYYWKVDSHDSTFPAMRKGPFWKFEVTEIPLIDAQPVSLVVNKGQNASFTIAVTSQSQPHFAWYHSVDNTRDTPADDQMAGSDLKTLSLANVGANDKGFYYCKVTNASGPANAVYSDVVKLSVLRLTAHWPLDSLENGKYADVTGEGHDATPPAVPTFITGIKNQAVQIDPNSWAVAGAWNPSEETGEFTLALWVNWNGQPAPAAYQGIISKSNAWGATTQMWQLGISSGSVLGVIRSGATLNSTYSLQAGQWELLVFTANGTTASIYQLRNNNVHVLTTTGNFTFGSLPTADLIIGGSNQASPEPFNGALDDIQVYNYKLTVKDIIDLYNQSRSGNFCNLPYGSSEFALDLDNDCIIDLGDIAVFATRWLECGYYPNCPFLR